MTSTHSNHGSHHNHGSHASSPSHSNHANSTYKSSSPSWSGSISGDHSVSAPTQQTTSLSTSKLGVYGSTGSLTALKDTADAARKASVYTGDIGSSYTVPSGQASNQASLTAVLQSAKGSINKYHNGTIRANFHTNHANSMGGGSANHSSHTSTGSTNTQTSTNAGVNTSATLYTGSGGHSSTAQSAHANSGGIKSTIYSTTVNPSYNISSGSKITSSQLSGILAQIKKITSSNVPSFGTYEMRGSLGVAHSNHASHGSHGPHGSHGSHGSHSNCSRYLKTNIKPYEGNALELLKKVNIQSFNYINNIGEDSSINHIGFIAEDTPEELATQYHDRMDYINCIGLLIKAIQELSEK